MSGNVTDIDIGIIPLIYDIMAVSSHLRSTFGVCHYFKGRDFRMCFFENMLLDIGRELHFRPEYPTGLEFLFECLENLETSVEKIPDIRYIRILRSRIKCFRTWCSGEEIGYFCPKDPNRVDILELKISKQYPESNESHSEKHDELGRSAETIQKFKARYGNPTVKNSKKRHLQKNAEEK